MKGLQSDLSDLQLQFLSGNLYSNSVDNIFKEKVSIVITTHNIIIYSAKKSQKYNNKLP